MRVKALPKLLGLACHSKAKNWQFPSKNRGKPGSQGRRQIQTERPCLRRLLKLTLAPSDQSHCRAGEDRARDSIWGQSLLSLTARLGNPSEVAYPSGVRRGLPVKQPKMWTARVSVGSPHPTLISSHPHQERTTSADVPAPFCSAATIVAPGRPHKRF